jgi:2-oxoisovalerate ferredoxin oxidoreductase beta subunit
MPVLFSCPETFYETFDRKGAQPWTTHYCPGCGHGLIHKYVAEAVDDFGVQDRAIFVSSVGCSVFAYYYLDMGNVQVAHGRCPAAATALKRAHPDALVLGYQGDGDLAAIGGNEILHAANRGENLTIFFLNNAIYGMTGGQMAPTSLVGMKTTTSPEGRRPRNEGFPLRVCELLATLDAPIYLERVAVGEPRNNHRARRAVRKAIRNQIENKGFSLVEILSPCPTGWKMTPLEAAGWTTSELTGTFPLGVFRDGHALDLGHPRHRAVMPLDRIPELLDLPTAEPARPGLDADRPIEPARIKVAGFGGQGVILLGKTLAHAGMLARRQVCWIPSYGPEMRGGTANCSVTISDDEIGSPLIENPTHLVAMNGPSFERFARDVMRGGVVFYNSSMVGTGPEPDGVELVAVPVNEIADRLGQPKVGNMVMLGAMLRHGCAVSREAVLAALPAVVDRALVEANERAIEAGMECAGNGGGAGPRASVHGGSAPD